MKTDIKTLLTVGIGTIVLFAVITVLWSLLLRVPIY